MGNVEESKFRRDVEAFINVADKNDQNRLAAGIVKDITQILPHAIKVRKIPDHLFEFQKLSDRTAGYHGQSEKEIQELSGFLLQYFANEREYPGKRTAFEFFLERNLPLIDFLFYKNFGQMPPAFIIMMRKSGLFPNKLVECRKYTQRCIRDLLACGEIDIVPERSKRSGRSKTLVRLTSWSQLRSNDTERVNTSELRAKVVDLSGLPRKSQILTLLKTVGKPLSIAQIALKISVERGLIDKGGAGTFVSWNSFDDNIVDR